MPLFAMTTVPLGRTNSSFTVNFSGALDLGKSAISVPAAAINPMGEVQS